MGRSNWGGGEGVEPQWRGGGGGEGKRVGGLNVEVSSGPSPPFSLTLTSHFRKLQKMASSLLFLASIGVTLANVHRPAPPAGYVPPTTTLRGPSFTRPAAPPNRWANQTILWIEGAISIYFGAPLTDFTLFYFRRRRYPV